MASTQISSGALYDNFKPQERLVLVLEALARGDEDEADRVRYSCPRKTYTAPDVAFDDRFSMALDFSMVACMDLRALTCQIRLLQFVVADVLHFGTMHHIDAQLAFVDGARCAERQSQSPYFAPKTGASQDQPELGPAEQDPEEQCDEEATSCFGEEFARRMEAVENRAEHTTELIVGVLARTGQDLAGELVNVWTAFSDFCTTRLGMTAERMLAACGYPAREELGTVLKQYAHLKAEEKSTSEYRDALYSVWDRRFPNQM
jgi:hypothetical protein